MPPEQLPDESNVGDARQASRLVRASADTLAALIVISSVVWAADIPRMFGFIAYTEQFLAMMLGLALALAYLRLPVGGGKRQRLPWYDALAAGLALVICLYVAAQYTILIDETTFRPLKLVVVGVLLTGLLLEALRRMVGPTLCLVVLVFILYALFGHLIPGRLAGRPIAIDRLAVYIGIDSNAVFGMPMIVGTIVVIPFILLGQVLGRCGGSDFFTDIAIALMGRYRGGSAKIAVVGSGLFGMISGSAVANVATVGTITIPMMRRAGYPAALAGAIEAVGSTGGQLMPPVMGAAAFLMAEFLQTSYGAVCVAATIPAILYYLSLFVQVDLEAARNGIAAVKSERSVRAVLAQGWHVPIPFVVLIVALFGFNLQPESAMLVALLPLLATGFALGYRGRKLVWRDLWPILCAAGVGALDIILICAAAGIIIGILNLSGLSFALTMILVELGHGSLAVLLLAAAVIALILGMGMPTVGVYVLVATLVAPAMIEMGVSPMAAHMFVFYFGMLSMITPPVALAAYAAASLAHSDVMRVGWTACRVGWVAFIVPFLFVAAPNLLMVGHWSDIGLALITAIAGLWFTAVGVVGHLNASLRPLQRALFTIAGILLLIPAQAFPGAVWTDILGALLGLFLLFVHFPKFRRRLSPTRISGGS
ncbi:MAG: TRAP transporter fused permease subunit [Rhodospirillales bacterium]|nr:TRAP transporter fused permease subunit [Rhodospirillales bacterium]